MIKSTRLQVSDYRICKIIGESNIWRFALKCSWRDFYLAILSTLWKETHAYSLNGVQPKWRTFNLAIFT